MGYDALGTYTGNSAIAIGHEALQVATGASNIAIGFQAGQDITTGLRNVFIGYDAGDNASQKVDADNSIAIGYNTYTDASNQIALGNGVITDLRFRSDTLVINWSDVNLYRNSANILATDDHFSAAGYIASATGILYLGETTTPTAQPNYGAIYTKNDNKLYFQDGAGTEHEVAFV